MKIPLSYGRNGYSLDVPADLETQVLHLNALPPLQNETEAVREALENPIGTPALSELARGKNSACIVISDVTRPVPNPKILAPMLEILEASGIPRQNITILNATGLHRPNLGQELEEMIGAEILANYRVENHVAKNESEMTDLGEIQFLDGKSARVAINSHYIEAELKITTGLIEPHFMAGYSGGRKLICPGIASAATILQFHAPPMIGNPNARAGNLNQNPVHAMSRAVAGKAGCDFICNVTLSEARQITGVFAGDLDAAHAAGIAHVDKQSKVKVIPQKMVVTTSAGYPLDTTFYQCVKGMVGALPALQKGGTLIIACSLSEGVGSAEFTEMCFSLKSVDEFLKRIYASPVQVDQWQLQELMLVLQHAGEVMIVSEGLDAQTLGKFLVTPMPSVEAAIEAARRKHGNEAKAVIIPEGPYVTPIPL
ncbi:Nickel-dependent lactate racemase [Abditibacterium utsteinense]|uniref:Nickel-dependent lactate racemase n=1 Tax=Abditibacterium utsteinense TaxID=1960156 RepID=A0A2S8SX18_9BACT|nr:nickel-dependent lactate racemase [Abditibacterium utsteinense]PQV65336.1 Nickel-dependent lactate racemase [Abditibacterium utsteinense]